MDLLENPFYILRVTPRDPRQKIMEMADERSLTLEPNNCIRACSDLTNPRKRLSAEMAWLPGLPPKRVEEILKTLMSSTDKVINIENLTTIAQCNLLAAAISRLSFNSPELVAAWIIKIAWACDELDADEIGSIISEERVAAGFPEVTDLSVIESELEERCLWYIQAIKSALDKLPARDLVTAMTVAVETATDNGKEQGPTLIHRLVDAYEGEAKEFLDKEAANIMVLVEKLSADANAKQPDDILKITVNQLCQVVKNWDSVAQPIQLSKKSQGANHEKSQEIAHLVRGLAVNLFNKHEKLQFSRQLTNILKEVFIEVVDVAELVSEDALTLDDIAKQRRKQEKESQEWRREITYEAKIGLILGSTLKISPEGIEWKGRHWNLDDIKRTRWGGTRRYTNGVYTGTNFLIFFAGSSSYARIDLKREDIFTNFTRRLWSAVGIRLVTEYLEGLRDGKIYHFGNMVLKDTGVTLVHKRFFGSEESVFCPWNELHIWNGPGVFCIGKKDDNKLSEAFSYQEKDNIHVLEACIRLFFKSLGGTVTENYGDLGTRLFPKSDTPRMSSLLRG